MHATRTDGKQPKEGNQLTHKIPFFRKTVQIGTHKKKNQDGEDNRLKMQELTANSERVLLRISSVFPFDFFPDHISVETTQVNIVRCYFFFDQSTQSIPIKNILEVRLQNSVFFSSLTFVDNAYVQNSVTVEYLKKREANRARKIIQGLIIASKEDIDLSKVEARELCDLSERLGRAQAVEP